MFHWISIILFLFASSVGAKEYCFGVRESYVIFGETHYQEMVVCQESDPFKEERCFIKSPDYQVIFCDVINDNLILKKWHLVEDPTL